MKSFGLKFHHLGLATDNSKLSLKILKNLGYKPIKTRKNKNYNVKNIICTSENHPTIEIIAKMGGKSPIDDIIKKNKNLIYHICYSSNDLKKTIAMIKKKKFSIIKISNSYLSPFEGVDASFYFLEGIGIIEIMNFKQKI
jgi:methylmalonyl-CoA/ethylmalonyl-CoA epimerase